MPAARQASISPWSLRRVLIGLASLLIASAVAISSGANFNATSANPGTMITGGKIVVSDSLAGQSVLTVTGLAPAGSATGTVTIQNGGNVPAGFQLSIANVVDTPTTPPFSAKLILSIDDLGDPSCVSNCPAAVNLYSGPLASLGTVPLGSFAAGVAHQYRFKVTFPDSGSGGADNPYGGASTRAEFRWTATQS